MSIHRAAVAAALVALAACAEAGLDESPRDTEALGYVGDYVIDDISHECVTDDPDRWTFHVQTQGWADRVTVSLAAAASGPNDSSDRPQREDHPLGNADYAPSGEWDVWDATLLAVPDTAQVEAGATTAFTCADEATTAFLVVMYKAGAPDEAVDCAWWGATPTTTFQGPPGLTCACIETDGDCSD